MSCTTISKTASTIDVNNSLTSKSDVELTIADKRISHNHRVTAKERRGGTKNVYNAAVSSALKANGNADVFVAPEYDISGTKYDIATKEWGGEWRMPSIDEFKELWDNTTKTLIHNYGYNGVSVIKFTAANGNYIILSLGGYKENNVLEQFDNFGFYWTSNLPEENNGWPAAWAIQSVKNGYQSSGKKFFGLLIRPVYGKRADTGADNIEHDYVDLGLSRLWATVNYGAELPTDMGTYVAWGEEDAKEEYTLENYKNYENGAYKEIDITTENGCDVVANTWGGKWHTHTYAELEVSLAESSLCFASFGTLLPMQN